LAYRAAMCIEAAGRVEARRARNRSRRPRSKPQTELRPEEPKTEAAGRYYGKDQADRELVSSKFRFKCRKMFDLGFLVRTLPCKLQGSFKNR